MPEKSETNVLLADRLAAAAGASGVAALVVNPFDVIKTRMQAQAAGGASASCSLHTQQPFFEYGLQSVLRDLPHVSSPVHKLIVLRQPTFSTANSSFHPSSLPWFHRRWAIASCPACAAPSSCAAGTTEIVYPSMVDTFRRILRHEGPAVFWRGSLASLAMSVPMVGIYMPMYDHLLEKMTPSLGAAAPVCAGTVSRTLAIYCVAPLELARTRMQASADASTSILAALKLTSNSSASAPTSHTHATPSSNAHTHTNGQPSTTTSGSSAYPRTSGAPSTSHTHSASRQGVTVSAAASTSSRPAMASVLTSEAVRSAARTIPSLWRGVNATLSRDVPFSALYWGMLEPARQELLYERNWRSMPSGLLFANFVAGFLAGGSAAIITTPLDVVKTRHQLSTHGSLSVVGTLKEVYGQEGLRGLYRGMLPRSARAAPACGIVVSTYEIIKDWIMSQKASW